MILYCMKWNAMQKAKASLPDLYTKYYDEPDNVWMRSEWDPEPFVPLREIPDFDLAPLIDSEGRPVSKGDVDVENCKRVYDGLREHITPAEASLETVWAGLCNDNFYKYMRERWKYAPDTRHSSKDAGAVEARFFFSSKGAQRNTLAKCWWISHLLYDEETQHDPYWRLEAIGQRGFSTKVSDIFVNYGFSRNKHVLAGIVAGIERCREAGVDIDKAETYLRPALKHLNAVGGLILLDALTTEEISDILWEGVHEVLNRQNGLEVSIDSEDDADVDLF